MTKVSVIVPVYGVEKYIEKCARSLFEQTMKEGIEFIFTNDCTKDKSIEILKQVLAEYPNRKSQVRIINHDTNQGLAVARITGVKAAIGKYVIHCDSDDWVEPNMYELMYAKAKETDADIVGCDIIEEFSTKSKILKQEFHLQPVEQAKMMLNVGSRRIERYLWNRLFRRSFYLKIGFNNPKINLWEDVCVTIPAHILTTKISYVSKPLYHYNRTNISSLVSSFNNEKLRQMITAGKYLNDFFKNKGVSSLYRTALNNRLLAAKLPLIIDHRVFQPSLWRTLWPDLDISAYPSPKMRILMHLADWKMDKLLKKFLN